MNDKLVSVVIPAYNASNYLSEAIESALSQTYPNIEIIVVNDGSTDNGSTREIAMSYGNKIRYYEKTNGGCASALNFGISKMQGVWFSWLSHDDLYLPNKIESLLNSIDDYDLNPNEVVLGCNDLIMGPSGRLSSNVFNNSVGRLDPVKAFGETLNKKTFNGCGLLIPKRVLDKVGTFSTEYKHLLDRELWMRIAVAGYDFYYIEDPLVVSRVHNQQVTVKAKDVLYEEEEKLIREYIPIVNTNDELLKHLCYFAAKRQHYELERDIKLVLKEHGALSFKVRTNLLRWRFEGKVKKLFRSSYKKALRKK